VLHHAQAPEVVSLANQIGSRHIKSLPLQAGVMLSERLDQVPLDDFSRANRTLLPEDTLK
jgi:hypothetical protein